MSTGRIGRELRVAGEAMGKDPFLLGFAFFFFCLHLPYLLPGITEEQLRTFSGRYTNLLLFPVLVFALLRRTERSTEPAERDLWRLIALAFTAWFSQELFTWLLPEAVWQRVSKGLLSDGFYALYYLFWFLAAGVSPHAASKDLAGRWIRSVRSVGAGALVWGVIAYLSVAPARIGLGGALDSWVPSLYLYFLLDSVLAIRFTGLAVAAPPRWRRLYGLLALYSAITAGMDLAEAWVYQGVLQWTNPLYDALWNLPFLALILATRFRRYDFGDGPTKRKELPTYLLGERSPLVTLAFAFPVLHFAFHQAGLGDPSVRGTRELMVLFFVLTLGLFAALENVLLLRLEQRAAGARRDMDALREAATVAERADREKTQFLTNVSHEIRTPMNGILGMVGLLLKSPLDARGRRHAEAIKASAEGLLQIFDDVLDYSRIEEGTLRLQPRPIEVRPTVQAILDMFGPSARGKGIELRLEVKPGVPEPLVCDGSRLRQVLLNLISNSIKFTPLNGKVDLVVEPWVSVERGEMVRFIVRDTGIGIPEEALADLFAPFVQAEETTAERFGGTGLGLAISKSIVEAMGGEIEVSSRPGKGSTFRFTVPAVGGERDSEGYRHTARAEPEESTDEDRRASERGPSERGSGHVLLVEDNPINQMVVLHQLEDLGYTADVASNGREALEMLAESRPDLVLMDCQMPEMDGYEATRQWRRQETGGRLPIVAITAHAFEEDRFRCLESGMDDFLSKPFDEDSFRRVLERWIDGPPAEASDRGPD